MSQDQVDYISDAMEMMGAGYDQPAAVIDPPRTVNALRENGIVDYKVWGWVKTSSKFRAHIKVLRGAKHAIWHWLALSVDETGKCKETIKSICEGTGYSHTEVIDSLKELDAMGYLSIQRDTKGNVYNPQFVARGGNVPSEVTVKKLESTPAYQDESSPSEVKSVPSYNRVKRVKGANALSKDEIQQVNDKVDYILASNQPENAWAGRELIRADLLQYADWYHKATGQVMTKRVQSAWWKAFGEWKAEGLNISDLQEAYEARSKWRKVATPVELTADAVAIHALPKPEQNSNRKEGEGFYV